MDFNKVYKALYLFNEEGYLNMKRIASMTGLHHKLVQKILLGNLYQSIKKEYEQDEARGDFSRVYPVPKVKVLSDGEYEALKDSYLKRLLNNKITMVDVRCFLVIDDVNEKQAEKMLYELETLYAKFYEETLEKKLDRLLEVLNKPEKWTITKEGNIEPIYPHPILDSQYNVKGIEYKADKNYMIPEALFDRYCIRKDKEYIKTLKEALPNEVCLILPLMFINWLLM